MMYIMLNAARFPFHTILTPNQFFSFHHTQKTQTLKIVAVQHLQI
jgi:hypothetical protein